MNLSEYILLSREERMSHIDLSSPCDFSSNWGEKHLDFFDIVDDVETWRGLYGKNHKCSNDTRCGGPICNNPRHWYIGTNSENMGDVEDRDRFKVGGRKNRGRKHTPRTEQHKANYRAGVKKRPPISEETRQKMREAQTRRRQNEKRASMGR
jgi:hypothetical protein